MKRKLSTLTRSEEQIMLVLWDLQKAFVKDIIARMPKPKPAYSTVSTFMRILCEKGYVGFTAYSKTYEYYPLVDRETYQQMESSKLLKDYFGGKVGNLVSFFADKRKLDPSEVDEIIELLKKFKKDQS